EELGDDVATVDVDPVAVRQPRQQAGRIARVELFAVPRLASPVRQDDHALVAVGPAAEAERGLVRAAADDDRVDRPDELLVAVGLLVERMDAQPVDAPVGPGDEAIEAGGDEDRELRTHRPTAA